MHTTVDLRSAKNGIQHASDQDARGALTTETDDRDDVSTEYMYAFPEVRGQDISQNLARACTQADSHVGDV